MRSFISAFIILIIVGGGFYFASKIFSDKDEIEGINMDKKENELIFPGDENYQQTNQQQESGDELKAEVLKKGTGQEAKEGNKATVHYAGFLEDGTKFDSSIDRGEPFQFTLGAGQVIQGWDLGVVGMKIGEIRRLYVPSAYGYGEQGSGNIIPPNANLIFEVELLGLD